MGSADFADPYLDPGSGLLRNLLGSRTQAELDAAEADLVAVRQIELARHPARFTGDLEHLKAIHRRLFQDVYDWAGHLRTVDIAKSRTRFIPVSMLAKSAGYLFAGLPRTTCCADSPATSSSRGWPTTTTS